MTVTHVLTGALCFLAGFVIATAINVGAVECLYG